MNSVCESLKEIIKEVLDVDDMYISDDTNLIYDLGMDSISIITLMIKIEEKFQIETYTELYRLENLYNLKHFSAILEAYIERK